MSVSKTVGKKVRSTNFSFTEKELLLKLALECSHILENKQSNLVSWKEKNACWLQIAQNYNAATTGCPRDATSLRSKYETIKKLLRGSESDLFKTGGSPHTFHYTSSSELEKVLYNLIQVSVDELSFSVDSDIHKLFCV